MQARLPHSAGKYAFAYRALHIRKIATGSSGGRACHNFHYQALILGLHNWSFGGEMSNLGPKSSVWIGYSRWRRGITCFQEACAHFRIAIMTQEEFLQSPEALTTVENEALGTCRSLTPDRWLVSGLIEQVW